MKIIRFFILLICISCIITACSGSRHALSKDEKSELYAKVEQDQQSVAPALEYHDQGGYEKGNI